MLSLQEIKQLCISQKKKVQLVLKGLVAGELFLLELVIRLSDSSEAPLNLHIRCFYLQTCFSSTRCLPLSIKLMIVTSQSHLFRQRKSQSLKIRHLVWPCFICSKSHNHIIWQAHACWFDVQAHGLSAREPRGLNEHPLFWWWPVLRTIIEKTIKVMCGAQNKVNDNKQKVLRNLSYHLNLKTEKDNYVNIA